MSLSSVLQSRQFAGWSGQGIISATNFAMLLIVSHWGGMNELGYYSLGFSVIAIMMAAQDSLVTRPYAIQLFKPPGGAEEHAYGTLVFGLALSVVMAAGLIAVSGVIAASGADRQLASVFLVLAVAAPFVLLRDFARRFCFANLFMHQALVIDAATSALILLSVLGIALGGALGAGTALLCYAAAGGVAGAVWFMFNRRLFGHRPGAARDTARQSWMLGKWLLLSQVTLQLQGYTAHWLILVMSGAAATGVYSACLSLVGLANPFLFGLLNFLTPNYVRARNEKGDMELRRLILRDAAMICGVMGAFALLLMAFGDMLLLRLFPRIDAAEAASVLTILAFASALGSIGAPATVAMSAIERGQVIAGLSLFSLFLGSLAVIVLLPAYGLVGAAWGMLLVEALGSLLRWALFFYSTASGPAAAGRKPAIEC